MATFRRGTASPDSHGTAISLTARHVVSALGAVAALSLLTACDGGQGIVSAPQTVSGTAPSASGDDSSTAGTTTNTGGTSADTGSSKGSVGTSASGNGAASTRCNASELRGHVGENNPGAGQENFPLVVTNFSGRTCTIDGYPGAAFVDASGKQMGPDPKRSSGSPTKITLPPGKSAWAGLSFGNPEVSGARTATPTGILITPPDEKESLKVDWTGGAVPVSSAANLTVFQAGTGA
ncbi:DUF4232 domain-containing protein [Streptomyces sp. CoH27]|uniref:DUF4232 domain-containing protein n=1 Tax=Streptomyces sp. CoH27 TaxID=2875763 RepID=UPI001CD44B3A|nr:DUF4232 domain-containing protein [Streptomyces sp. CoH27]